MSFAKTPKPPYYAVIFTAVRTEGDNGYDEMAEKMVELAMQQEGFLGIEWAGGDAEITVSYWQDLESIRKWYENAEHKIAQAKGYEIWYKSLAIRVCKVERDNFHEK